MKQFLEHLRLFLFIKFKFNSIPCNGQKNFGVWSDKISLTPGKKTWSWTYRIYLCRV